MSNDRVRLEILTPEKAVLQQDVLSVYLQGSQGRFGILPQHTALIAKLDFGILEIQTGEGREELICGSGMVEVQDGKVTVLVRSAERREEIDEDRSKRAKERAKSRRDSKDKNIDMERAEAALYRAQQRLRFVEGAREIR